MPPNVALRVDCPWFPTSLFLRCSAGGSLILAADWTPEDVESKLSAHAKRQIADRDIRLYIVNSENAKQYPGLPQEAYVLAMLIGLSDISASTAEFLLQSLRASVGDEAAAALDNAVDEIEETQAYPVPAEWKVCAWMRSRRLLVTSHQFFKEGTQPCLSVPAE